MDVKREDIKTLVTKIIAGQLAFFLYYAALYMAPLTILVICVKTDAFFVVILGYIVNREKITLMELIGIFVCFGAVAIISYSQSDAELNETEQSNMRVLGIILVLIHAFFFAL